MTDEPEAEAFYPESGPDREEMVSDYLPESEEWMSKTVLDINDPISLAALMELEQLYPEVDDLQPIVDSAVETFLKSRISVGGRSRDEFNRILEAMHGGHPDTETKRWAAMFGADDEDD